jgi:YfiH family protein
MSTLHIQYSQKTDGDMDFRSSENPEEIIENRKKFLAQFGLQLEDTLVMELEHQDKILLVNTSHKPGKPTDHLITEALITQEKGLVLFLKTADCLPITFYDPVTETLALAHLGRKSTDLKLSEKVLAQMKEIYQSEPKNVQVFIGPGIHKESYIYKAPLQEYSEELTLFTETLSNGEISIDLVGCNIAQLTQAGVKKENITVDPTDTATSPQYFSHYRSVRTGEPEARFATIAWLA